MAAFLTSSSFFFLMCCFMRCDRVIEAIKLYCLAAPSCDDFSLLLIVPVVFVVVVVWLVNDTSFIDKVAATSPSLF